MAINRIILDKKPVNRIVADTKPNNAKMNSNLGTEQFYTVNIAAGQPMGLLLALTYKTGFSVITSRT